MAGVHTIWGIHMEWDDATGPNDTKDLAIGWAELGDLNALPSSRDAFKAAFTKIYPTAKPGEAGRRAQSRLGSQTSPQRANSETRPPVRRPTLPVKTKNSPVREKKLPVKFLSIPCSGDAASSANSPAKAGSGAG